ncbi:MAG: MMPL family transporter, partial [Myxococcota bacterium]|nr:MMPL family transporter [Myxococcota bacterium]
TDVGTFYEVNKRFGGLDLALVGVEADDVFSPGFVRDLQSVTRDLDALPGLAHVLSITNVEDFAPDPVAGGIVTGLLVDKAPTSPEESAALRAKVLSRPHAVGSLVSRDGKAVMIYCSLAEGAEPREMTAKIREVVGQGLAGAKVYEGGSPFISTYIYDTTQADMGRLTPWAVAVIVLILLFAFRDVVGSLLILVSTGVAIAVAVGAMDLLGESFNIVLGGMPVILFAVGSAYSIHVLSRYYSVVGQRPVDEAMVETLVAVGPTVVAAGLTTVAGLLSFLMMDNRPLRIFGAFTALGILGALVLALTFVPATVVLLGARGRARVTGQRNALGRFAADVQRRRPRVLVCLVLVALGSAYFVSQVDTRMDPRSFYEPGSPPDASDQFMVRAFGGSQFL